MLRLCELYPAPQGEGPTTGTPSLFVRLSGCNLHCSWCDSFFTWNFEGTKFSNEKEIRNPKVKREEEMKAYEIEEFTNRIKEEAEFANVKNIVITGGEPTLQQKDIAVVIKPLKEQGYTFEIETNGTNYINDDLFELLDQINCSPKLENSGNQKELRFQPKALKRIADHKKSNFKFVVMNESDLEEIREIVKIAGMPNNRVYLMPEGVTRESQITKYEETSKIAAREGYNVSPRVHILLHDSKRAV